MKRRAFLRALGYGVGMSVGDEIGPSVVLQTWVPPKASQFGPPLQLKNATAAP